ncbi:MAG: TatD family hydrolase [Deltaproteobacteria bacterium]|nr:TatD family hydrolase [Deltaproteobacteria bacterium]
MIDTHAHLKMAAEGDWTRVAEQLQRARLAGVHHVVAIGAGGDREELQSALDAARQFPGVSAICGIHPHDAQRLEEADGDGLWQAVELACAHESCIGVGETGLDFHYDLSPREAQARIFVRHIALARQLGKPLCIHTRSAEPETLQILKDERAEDVGGVIHCFSGTAAFGLSCVRELGFYLSIPGIVTFKNPGEIAEAVRQAPADRLLVETDSPFLAPIPHRGKKNEPAFVGLTLAKVAELRGWSVAEADAITTANAERLFGPRLRQPLSN